MLYNIANDFRFKIQKQPIDKMSTLQKHFIHDRRQNIQTRNKQNNLSFRNIAANNQLNNQNQNQNIKSPNLVKVDKSFRSICPDESTTSFYTSGEDLQQGLNYVGSCFNHANKLAQYQETASQRQYCKLCAAKLASLGYKLERSENSVSRDISPCINRFRSKDQNRLFKHPSDVFESKIRQTSSTLQVPPVKFSTIISQKNRTETLEAKYEQSEKIIEQYMEIYSQKMDKIEELINGIRIKDTQYINRLKEQNKAILQQAQGRQQYEVERSNYDLFGKSIFKESSSIQGSKFKLPTDQRIQKLARILQFIQQSTLMRDKSPSTTKIPLIKSINSTQSSGNVQNTMVLKNSSSVSNLSTKSNFKKQKRGNEKEERFKSQINQAKAFKHDDRQIESSRFSSNSGIVRKKNRQSGNQNNMTESTQLRRRNNTDNSERDSNSCQDTPESIKSKISANSFVLPKNAAVTMFEKINVCESIDVMPEEVLGQARVNQITQGERPSLDKCSRLRRVQSRQVTAREQIKNSSPLRRSNGKSVSVHSKGRKSFNRYQNMANQQ